jgi:hypothetical protein
VAARCGVEDRFERLTYRRVRCAFEPIFALHRIHHGLLQRPAGRAAQLLALCVLAAGIARGADAPVLDPMQPFRYVGSVSGGVAAAPRFALTAVLISPTRRVAIVNGKPYERGEIVSGAEIVRIDADAVHLREHGNELVVPLGHAAAAAAAKSGQGESVK